jgi:predicted nuclease of predicted toxin-antitoxin system
MVLRDAGYDASTVVEHGLGGSADPGIASVCRNEDRALVTLDVDFADIRAYPPNQYSGLIVLRLRTQDRPHVVRTVTRLIPVFSTEALHGRLWIVEVHVGWGDEGTPTSLQSPQDVGVRASPQPTRAIVSRPSGRPDHFSLLSGNAIYLSPVPPGGPSAFPPSPSGLWLTHNPHWTPRPRCRRLAAWSRWAGAHSRRRS